MSDPADAGDKDDDDLFCLDLESLDRALQEVEALLLIYGKDDDDEDTEACHRHGADDGPLSSARMTLSEKHVITSWEDISRPVILVLS
jgi:hypothetical protein